MSQGYSFYHFWVIKGKPKRMGGGGGEGKITTPTTIMVKIILISYVISGGVINSRFF